MTALPSTKTVFMAQVRLLLAKHRRGLAIALGIALAQVVAMSTFGIVFGISINPDASDAGVAFTHVSKLEEAFELELHKSIWALFAAFIAACFFGLFWPFAIWADESPSKRDAHWSLPVDRRQHDFLRHAAGCVIVLGVTAILYFAALVPAAFTGGANLSHLSLWAWLCAALGPLVPYGLGSAFTVRSEHPAAWFWGTLGVTSVLWTILVAVDWNGPAHATAELAIGRFSLITAASGALTADLLDLGTLSGPAWFGLFAATLAVLSGILWAITSIDRR